MVSTYKTDLEKEVDRLSRSRHKFVKRIGLVTAGLTSATLVSLFLRRYLPSNELHDVFSHPTVFLDCTWDYLKEGVSSGYNALHNFGIPVVTGIVSYLGGLLFRRTSENNKLKNLISKAKADIKQAHETFEKYDYERPEDRVNRVRSILETGFGIAKLESFVEEYSLYGKKELREIRAELTDLEKAVANESCKKSKELTLTPGICDGFGSFTKGSAKPMGEYGLVKYMSESYEFGELEKKPHEYAPEEKDINERGKIRIRRITTEEKSGDLTATKHNVILVPDIRVMDINKIREDSKHKFEFLHEVAFHTNYELVSGRNPEKGTESHLEIYRQNNDYIIRDLGSENGTDILRKKPKQRIITPRNGVNAFKRTAVFQTKPGEKQYKVISLLAGQNFILEDGDVIVLAPRQDARSMYAFEVRITEAARISSNGGAYPTY